MKKFVLVVLLLLSGQTDSDELQKLFHNFNVQSIDASIVQVIAETGKETQRYEGRYGHYNDCMRLDYSKPFRQIVIVNWRKALVVLFLIQRAMDNVTGECSCCTSVCAACILNERIVVKVKEVWYGFFN